MSRDIGRDSVTLNGHEGELPNKYNGKTAVTKSELERDLKKRNSNGVDIEVSQADGEGDFKYHNLHWWQVGMLMIAETISLGILSLPSVFATLGMPGGVILLVGLGIVATYTGYNIGLFKLAYPHVRNQADAGEVMGGPILREILGTAQIVFLVFIAASHVLTGMIALQTIANDNTCTVIWAAIIAAVSAFLTMPRTFAKVSYLSIFSFLSILSAVIVCMIGVGIEGKRAPISTTATPGIGFVGGFGGATNIVFAYAGHASFFNFISEMKRPQDYNKALYLLQGADMSLYLIVAVVVYYYVGPTASSPALGNLSLTLSRVAYGIAIPTIIIAGVVNANVAAKLAMQRIFSPDNKHYKEKTAFGWAVWTSIVVGIWAIGFVIAEVIPFFNDLLSVISALFASFFTYAESGIFFLYLNPRRTWFSTKRMIIMTTINIFVIIIGAVIMVAGLYSSISSIVDGYRTGTFGTPFQCAPREE